MEGVAAARLWPPRGDAKAATIAGEGPAPARYVRRALGTEGDSPTSWYAIGLAALLSDDDALASPPRARIAKRPPGGGRARAVRARRRGGSALAYRNADRYAAALAAILADFEQREDHLTGVEIADTALMFERIAAQRGSRCARLSARPR